jgi:carbon starvation protein
LVGVTGRVSAAVATAVTCFVPLLFVLVSGEGAWASFWALFGTSNQRLAALSLMGLTVWLKRTGRRYFFTLIPLVLVSAVTATSLVMQLRTGVMEGASRVQRLNAGVALLLLGLAVAFLWSGVRALSVPTVSSSRVGAPPAPAAQV